MSLRARITTTILDSNMIIHVMSNVLQEQACNESNTAKGDTDIVHIWVALCIGKLSSKNNLFPHGIASNEWQSTNIVNQASRRKVDNGFNCLFVHDAKLLRRSSDIIQNVLLKV